MIYETKTRKLVRDQKNWKPVQIISNIEKDPVMTIEIWGKFPRKDWEEHHLFHSKPYELEVIYISASYAKKILDVMNLEGRHFNYLAEYNGSVPGKIFRKWVHIYVISNATKCGES